MVNNKRCQALLALFFGCCLCTLAAALEVENQLVSARNGKWPIWIVSGTREGLAVDAHTHK